MDTIITTEEMIGTTPLTCLNNGSLDSVTQTCKCYNGYIGDTCERIMMDCTEGFKSGHYNEDTYDNYFIKPTLAPTAFEVHCNMKDGGGGSTLMKNSEWWPFVNRNENWNTYKDGFGELEDNHWLGLDQIHYITSSRPHHLFIEVISDIDLKGRWRKYENFKVKDESTNYRMTYSGSFPWTQSESSADPDWTKVIESTPLGDSMIGLNGSAFSTFDRDNDMDAGRNCAQEYQGGWWYNACADCNPNGELKMPRNSNAVNEAFWKYDFMNNYTPHIEMTLRAA
ncbi:fibrinogen-like protein 1 [Patella vulgata]|uniref:fibrinogen-like protein 1 n=1 Tax=Patella vulgata TaxID=6465 RepID=UPI0024A8F41F|nr:fibrinogen-like protein 1 [Patella vulgata]